MTDNFDYAELYVHQTCTLGLQRIAEFHLLYVGYTDTLKTTRSQSP